jgi:hypothetical protein
LAPVLLEEREMKASYLKYVVEKFEIKMLGKKRSATLLRMRKNYSTSET